MCEFLPQTSKNSQLAVMKKKSQILTNAKTLETLRVLRETLNIGPRHVAKATGIPVRTLYDYYKKNPNNIGHLDQLQIFLWELDKKCQMVKSDTILM